MAKINIPFNNKNYNVDESSLSTASSALRSHLQNVMNGTGAMINLDGSSYNVDSAKLQNATSNFVSHLGTVSGSGYKITVGGVEYGIDSTKMQKAIADLHAVLGGLLSGGDGSTGDDSDAFPIEWNSMDVVGNTSFNVEGMSFVKVSNVSPSVESLDNTVVYAYIGDVTECLKLVDTDYFDGAYLAVYDNNLIVVSVPAAGVYNGIAVAESGLYAIDFSQMGNVNFAIAVALPALPAPETPTVASVSDNSITLNIIDGCEYSKDGTTWQDSPTFDGLNGGSSYVLYARYKATDKNSESPSSSVKARTTGYSDFIVNTSNRSKVGYTDDATNLVIPETLYDDNTETWYKVTAIDEGAFRNCGNLISVTIPDSVTSIGKYAFYECNSLTEFLAEDACLESIESFTFMNCKNLNNVKLPSGLKEIKLCAFEYCDSLASITIPSSVSTIGNNAFFGCPALSDIKFEGSCEQWSKISLGDAWNSNVPATKITCSDGSVEIRNC